MSKALPLVFVSRPPPGDVAFVEGLRAVCDAPFDVLSAPLISVQPSPFDQVPADLAHVVFTSQRAVEAVAHVAWPASVTAWCVGDKTAELAATLGVTARSAQGNVDDLARLILKNRPIGAVYHLRGRDVAGELVQMLARGGIDCKSRVVYAQEPRMLSRATKNQLADAPGVIAPIFSPKTGESFINQGLSGPHVTVVAISAAVAQVFDGQPLEGIKIAARSDLEAMIAQTVLCLGGKPSDCGP